MSLSEPQFADRPLVTKNRWESVHADILILCWRIESQFGHE